MLCSPPPATTLASSCAGSEGFCAPCCRRSSQRSRIHNRPKTGRALLLHERLDKAADDFSAGRIAAAAEIATATEITAAADIAATAIIGAAAIRPAAGVAGIRTTAVIGAAAAAVAIIIIDNGFAEAGRHSAHAAIEAVGIAMSEHRRDALKEQRAAGDAGRRRRGRAQETAASSAAEHADARRVAGLRIARLLGIARLRVLRRALLRGRWRDIGTAAPRPSAAA